jgi:hypothetical protein
MQGKISSFGEKKRKTSTNNPTPSYPTQRTSFTNPQTAYSVKTGPLKSSSCKARLPLFPCPTENFWQSSCAPLCATGINTGWWLLAEVIVHTR